MTSPGGEDERLEARVIGYVRSPIPDREVSRRRREIVVEIEVLPAYAEGLAGIEDYSHLFVLFWMHKTDTRNWRARAHPRGNPDLPEVGVFAARGRNHPNPLGLAVVELLGRDGPRLRVRRLDAYDGTPVLDIKPYDRYDRVENLRLPDWWQKLAVGKK